MKVVLKILGLIAGSVFAVFSLVFIYIILNFVSNGDIDNSFPERDFEV